MEKTDIWAPLGEDQRDRERIWGKAQSFSADVWYRFRHKPTAIIGLAFILLLMVFAVGGPYISPHDYDTQNLDYVNMPPFIDVFEHEGRCYYFTGNLKIIEVSENGELLGALKKVKDDMMKKRVTFDAGNGLVVALDYNEMPARLTDEEGNVLSDTRAAKHNRTYMLGTDQLGRDILTRLMFGARISLLIALIAAAVNFIIGILYGGVSAMAGGTADMLMMRFVEIISTIPLMLYVILIMVWLNSGLLPIILALGLVYWVNMARVVRGQLLSLKQSEFVICARTLGTSGRSILFRHLIPNAMGPIIVTGTMQIPQAIFVEAFLSFIGLGVVPPMASLGTMCNDAIGALRSAPYQLFWPALLICLMMFAFNFVGDGLRDALDPKLRK